MVTNAATGFRRKRKVLFSAEDLLHLPDNGRRFELVKGKIYEMAPAGGRHGRAAIVTGALLEWHTKPLGLGMVFGVETGYRLARDPDTVRAPDVSFVSSDRLSAEDLPDGFLELAPDLVVEVVSPNDRPGEVREKISEWLEAGTRMAIVLCPRTKTACGPSLLAGAGDSIGAGHADRG